MNFRGKTTTKIIKMGKNNHEHHEKLLKNVSDDSKAKFNRYSNK